MKVIDAIPVNDDYVIRCFLKEPECTDYVEVYADMHYPMNTETFEIIRNLSQEEFEPLMRIRNHDGEVKETYVGFDVDRRCPIFMVDVDREMWDRINKHFYSDPIEEE